MLQSVKTKSDLGKRRPTMPVLSDVEWPSKQRVLVEFIDESYVRSTPTPDE